MKAKLQAPPATETQDGSHPYAVRYFWSTAGTICSGRTVVFGKTRSAAERTFFKDHKHVQKEAA
jgi:hypothetical protein